MALQLPSSFVDVEREEMEYVDGGTTYYGAKGWAVAAMFAAFGGGADMLVGGAVAMLTGLGLGIGGILAAASLEPAAQIFSQLASAGLQGAYYMAIYGHFTISTNNNLFGLFCVTH